DVLHVRRRVDAERQRLDPHGTAADLDLVVVPRHLVVIDAEDLGHARLLSTPPFNTDGTVSGAMKIAIVGTGAMGSVYAGVLAKAGHQVWAIDRWAEHVDAIARSGLSVSGASGSFVVDDLHVGLAPADAGPSDLWIVATKAHDVDAAAAGIAPLLRPSDVVMA